MEAALERWNTLRAEDILSVRFPWTIENFSTSCKGKKYSHMFYTGIYKWRLLMYPKGIGMDYVSVYLDVPGAAKSPAGWSRLKRFSLTVVNELDRGGSVTKETIHMFDDNDTDWGFTSLIPLVVFNDHSQGYLVRNIYIIEATVAVPKRGGTTAINQIVTYAPVQALSIEIPVPVISEPAQLLVNADPAPLNTLPAELTVHAEC